MVHTTTPPALSTANQQAASIGLFGPLQQDAVARYETEIIHENMCNPVRCLMQLSVCPFTTWKTEHDPVAIPRLDHAVEQLSRAIHPTSGYASSGMPLQSRTGHRSAGGACSAQNVSTVFFARFNACLLGKLFQT